MGAQAVRRRDRLTLRGGTGRARWRRALLAACALLASAASAQDTSFDDGPALARRLLAGVVRVHGGEHGFGLVVGADAAFVYIATAQHVVGAAATLAVHGCLNALPQSMVAERVAGFEAAAGDDLALLRVPRPPEHRLAPRALAPAARVGVTDAVWLLGRDDVCAVLPRTGAIAARPGSRSLWRIDMPGVLGGSSGAPVATGRGIVGLVTDSDNANVTALDVAQIARRAREAGVRFDLVEARNEPPTDPQAAEQDLAEMLNQYLFKVRDSQRVLREPAVLNAEFRRSVGEYNEAAERFRDAMNKYDGTLRRHWEPEVAPQWAALRDRLWATHQNFLLVNEHARKIIETERVPKAVRDRMEALEPELVALQGAIAQFLRSLAQRRIVDADLKP